MNYTRFFAQPLLYMSIFIAMGMAVTELPPWVILFAGVLILWRWLHEQFKVPKVTPLQSTFFGFALFVFTYLQYRTIWGQVESAAILTGLIAILILNYSNFRDHRTLVLLGFILSAMKPMFALDLTWAIPAFFCIVGFWLSLIPSKIPNKPRLFFRMSIIATPMLLLLFALFPRIVIFQSNRYSQSVSVSGFSDDLNPGRVASLVQSTRTSFFAEFDRDVMISDGMVSNKDLYWRGSTLTEAFGLEWRRARGSYQNPKRTENDSTVSGVNDLENASNDPTADEKTKREKAFESRFLYTIIIEPNQHRFVFTLDVPSRLRTSTQNVDQFELGTYRTAIPSTQQQRFQFAADPDYTKTNDPTDDERYLELRPLPPRTQAWVDQALTEAKDTNSKLKLLEEFFKKDFRYTLDPGTYERGDLDAFLFDRKRGFCEHFAAGYATLARALGIPARVVIGYQGGEYNPLGNFWKVVERDAHAWVEIGINNRWRRVDPTTWVAPLRLNMPSSQFFDLSESEQLQAFAPNRVNTQPTFERVWNQAILFFDNINYRWTIFLLEFDKEKQLALLANLFSIDGLTRFLNGILILLTVVVCFVLLKRVLIRQTKRDLLKVKLNEMVQSLNSKGISVPPVWTAHEIVRAHQKEFPDQALKNISSEIDRHFYQNTTSEFVPWLDRSRYLKEL